MDFDLSNVMPRNLFDYTGEQLGYPVPSNSPFIESTSSGEPGWLAPAQTATQGAGLLDFALPGLGTAIQIGVGGILGHLSDKYKAKRADEMARQQQQYTLQQLAMRMAMEKQLADQQAAVQREQIAAQKAIAGQTNLNNAYSNSVDAALTGAQVGNASIGNFLRAIGR